MGDNVSPIDEHASAVPHLASARPAEALWRHGVRLEAIANLAHELRTPVQVLLGYVDILRDDFGSEFSAESRELLDRMNANVHDLAQTIDNIMHFVLSEVNAEAMVDEDVTPASLLSEIAPVIDAANQQKQLTLKFDFAAAPELFCIPRRALKSILLNLTLNAIKFTDTGSVTVALRRLRDVASRDGGSTDAIEVEISDTGPGLSPAMLERAAEPFAQLSNTSARRYRGLGLGLAVVQRSVRALGGKLELRSNGDQGANFIVTIPVRVRENAARAVRTSIGRRMAPVIPTVPTAIARKPGNILR